MGPKGLQDLLNIYFTILPGSTSMSGALVVATLSRARSRPVDAGDGSFAGPVAQERNEAPPKVALSEAGAWALGKPIAWRPGLRMCFDLGAPLSTWETLPRPVPPGSQIDKSDETYPLLRTSSGHSTRSPSQLVVRYEIALYDIGAMGATPSRDAGCGTSGGPAPRKREHMTGRDSRDLEHGAG
jgi:hypothetical protein